MLGLLGTGTSMPNGHMVLAPSCSSSLPTYASQPFPPISLFPPNPSLVTASRRTQTATAMKQEISLPGVTRTSKGSTRLSVNLGDLTNPLEIIHSTSGVHDNCV